MDKYRLMYEMKSKGVTVEEMCGVLGICSGTFYKKCNGKTEFTLGEIQKIMEHLRLESPIGIFFAQ